MTNYYQFSQSDLNLLETEPLQFVKNYLDNRLEPRHLENQNRTQRGKSFHVLMQQYNLGLNIDHMTGEDQSLIDQVKALINQTQQLWFSPQIILREAEYQVNYTCENYIFTAIYDLLVLFKDKIRKYYFDIKPLP